MAEMMKAAVVHEFGAPLHIEGSRIPAPGPGTDPSQGGCPPICTLQTATGP